jgi:hypothetical protein
MKMKESKLADVGLDNLRHVDIKDIVNSKMPADESMSHLLQTHRASMNPFYHRGID